MITNLMTVAIAGAPMYSQSLRVLHGLACRQYRTTERRSRCIAGTEYDTQLHWSIHTSVYNLLLSYVPFTCMLRAASGALVIASSECN